MGLKMRHSLFYGVEPAHVYGVYARFWADQGHPLIVLNDPPPRQNRDEFDLYESNNGWVILSWNAGWEWDMRRRAQLAVSRELGCVGFLIFVDDGDYWGYELFRNGVAVDHFVQEMNEADTWFPESNCRGRADLITALCPWVSARDAEAYLVQEPDRSDDGERDLAELAEAWAAYDRLDVPARPGDEFTRFHECAAVDFMRLLGVKVALRDDYVTMLSPIWRAFEITGWERLRSR